MTQMPRAIQVGIPTLPPSSPPPEIRKKKMSFMGYEEIHENQPPTSYIETLANLFKGAKCF